jgi:hypothetical protein
MILLDEDGNLGLADVTPQGIKVLARAAVLQNLSWPPPTLALRDENDRRLQPGG